VEEELRAREETHRVILSNLSDVVAIMSSDGIIRHKSPNIERWFGWKPEDLVGTDGWETVHPDDLERVRKEFYRLLSEDRSRRTVEYRYKCKDGTFTTIELSAVNLTGDPRIDGVLMCYRDVTKRRNAEEAARRYVDVIQQMQIGLYLYHLEEMDDDRTLRLIDANPASEELTGVPVEDVIGKTLDENFPGLREKGIPQTFAETVRTGNPAVVEDFYYGDDRVVARAYSMRAFPLPDRCMGVAFEDITKRKQAEEASRKSEEKYRRLFALSPNGVAVTSFPDGRIQEVNERIVDYFGYTRDEAIGRTGVELGLLTSEQRADLEAILEEIGKLKLVEVTFRTKAGEEMNLLASAELFDLEGEQHILWGLVDVTEQKLLETQLRQSQKLETLGTLASGIAHDFNNLLVPILGYADLANRGIAPDHPVMKEMESHLFDSADRARDLVEQIFTFGRKTEPKRTVLDPGFPVRNALRLLDTTLPASIKIQRRFVEPLKKVLADGNQLQQVVANLCTNAAHALGDVGGVVEVALESVDLDEDFKRRNPGFPMEEAVRLVVRDSGMGMEVETLERLFEPFFTTKEIGEGTGLGLSVVHGIVTGHGGVIEVESVAGQGSTFEVYFPTAQHEVSIEDSAGKEAPRGTERVLFVDDDAATCETARSVLETLGYEVATSESGPAALWRFKESPDAFDLVVTDFDMPRMNGIHLAVELMETRSDLPVILLTGAHEGRIRAAQNLGLRGYVRKPFTSYELSRAIRDALGG
jgi:PAS domain S-box-containing protein